MLLDDEKFNRVNDKNSVSVVICTTNCLENGIYCNMFSQKGVKVLHIAVEKGFAEIVELILQSRKFDRFYDRDRVR
jgi:sulfur relay (sulfurtransferase) complex TusBCD TusD component (DsrE family)